MDTSLNTKVKTATKWSAISEIAAKLVTPITSMVLARLLTPEAFGVVTTLAMIISFAEIFTDAGFQKYLVQHEFKDNQDREESTNVAFWSNLFLSLVLWGVIAIFANPLAALVGNPGLGNVLIVACVSIPLAAFSSIQMALYKRDLDFKTLFKVRIISSLIPLLVTVPLAFWLRSYWALIIGTITVNLVNAVLLTVFSKWKPRWFYSFGKFKEMFSSEKNLFSLCTNGLYLGLEIKETFEIKGSSSKTDLTIDKKRKMNIEKAKSYYENELKQVQEEKEDDSPKDVKKKDNKENKKKKNKDKKEEEESSESDNDKESSSEEPKNTNKKKDKGKDKNKARERDNKKKKRYKEPDEDSESDNPKKQKKKNRRKNNSIQRSNLSIYLS